MGIEDFLHLLHGVRKAGEGWQACCPAHEDRNPSLSISQGEDGRILLCCHGGCSTEAVLDSMGLTKKDLFPEGTWRPLGRPRRSTGHTEGNKRGILEPTHENNTYTEEELASALRRKDVSLTGAFLRVS